MQLLLDAIEQVNSRERVTAAQEKIVIAADVLALEHIAPQLKQYLLNLRARFDLGIVLTLQLIASTQLLVVNLEVRQPGERIEDRD